METATRARSQRREKVVERLIEVFLPAISTEPAAASPAFFADLTAFAPARLTGSSEEGRS